MNTHTHTHIHTAKEQMLIRKTINELHNSQNGEFQTNFEYCTLSNTIKHVI